MTSFLRHYLTHSSINKNDVRRNNTYALKKPKIGSFFKVKVYSKIRFYQSWRRQWPYKNYETQYINHNINHCKTHIFFGFLNLTLMQDVCLLTIIMLAQHPCTLKWWDYDTIGVPVTYCSNKIKITKRIVSLGYTIKS